MPVACAFVTPTTWAGSGPEIQPKVDVKGGGVVVTVDAELWVLVTSIEAAHRLSKAFAEAAVELAALQLVAEQDIQQDLSF